MSECKDECADHVQELLKQIEQLETKNKRLRALCLRESGVLYEALKRTNMKSMIEVVAISLNEQALKGIEL